MDTNEVIALLIIGIVAGTAASSVTNSRRNKRTISDWIRNTVIGIVGAIIGTLLFNILDINLPGFLSAAITPADLLIAFVGAIIVIFGARFLQR